MYAPDSKQDNRRKSTSKQSHSQDNLASERHSGYEDERNDSIVPGDSTVKEKPYRLKRKPITTDCISHQIQQYTPTPTNNEHLTNSDYTHSIFHSRQLQQKYPLQTQSLQTYQATQRTLRREINIHPSTTHSFSNSSISSTTVARTNIQTIQPIQLSDTQLNNDQRTPIDELERKRKNLERIAIRNLIN